MIFKFASIINNKIDNLTIFAVVRHMDNEGVYIDRYCNCGRTKMTSHYMPYEEFNRYYNYGLWVFED